MPQPESVSIELAPDLAAELRHVVDTGEFTSPGEVVMALLADWQAKRAFRSAGFDALKADIEAGMADLAEGRVHAFDVDRIAARGRASLAARSNSA